MAANVYISLQDYVKTADLLEQISQEVVLEETSQSFQDLYNGLLTLVGSQVAIVSYDEGYAAYENRDYETAIPLLERAVMYDGGHSNGWYYLAQSYRNTEQSEKAIEAYNKVIELVPDSDRASRAKRYIKDLSE